MNSWEIREKFLDFFKKRGHETIPSVSLFPENDPTLLFVNSGMFPLVAYLLGETHPKGKRLANFQRSFRTDDIEEVGSHRHTTFFEMLGNWSLGDYFKKEQLNWWFEFLVEVIGLDPKRLYQTVYLGGGSASKDEESISIIRDIFKKYGIKAEEGPETRGKGELGPGVEIDFEKYRIFAYGDKNWWQRGDAVGELGGPDSETFYDTGKEHDSEFGKHCHLNCDCGRFLEIGNSVFMQYRKTENGWTEIKNKNVDFGGGLERITMVSEGFGNIFETDLFRPIISKVEEISQRKYGDDPKSFEIVSDHLKASAFIMGDERGVGPSNKQQGYFVRRLIRRALRYGRRIGIEQDSWVADVSREAVEMYQKIYPELRKNSSFIYSELKKEEARFRGALERGLREFDKIAERERAISGERAFYLYQTYGFPIEMIKEITEERDLEFDSEGFSREFEKHKKLSQTASAGLFKGGLADAKEETTRLHTATHLLLAALREILGERVVQKGSNITSERLRFDFSYPKKLTSEEISQVEDLVNRKIGEDIEVKKEEMGLDKALKSGALAAFGERYPDKVTVYSVGDFSKEICHGPHVERTSKIGRFRIIKEEASGAGVRRIKAAIE